MIVLCYHNGALGHAVGTMLECCTLQGQKPFPDMMPGGNLHHVRFDLGLFRVQHPFCDIEQERALGNITASSSSQSRFGRLMILLMGLHKWNGASPELDSAVVYKQQGHTFGEQIEILAVTLRDKCQPSPEWYLGADHVLDIMHIWDDVGAVASWISDLGLVPQEHRLREFCQQVADSNQCYRDTIARCHAVVHAVKSQHQEQLDLSFLDVAICYAMLLEDLDRDHRDIKLLKHHPRTTTDFQEAFFG